MKNTMLIFATLISIGTISSQTIEVKEGSDKFSSGIQNSLSTVILENSKDDIESEWKSLLKNFKNEKVKIDKGELFADNVIIKEWGNNTVDIYTTFEEDKKAKAVKMHVCFDLGGAYLKSTEQRDKYNYAAKMIRDFAVKMTKIPLESKVKDAEKLLDKYQDDQKDLEKDNKNLKSDIVSYKGKIVNEEKEIATKEEELKKKNIEISTQQKIIDVSIDAVSEQAKSSKKIHEKLLGQKQDLEKNIKDSKEDVKNNNGKIKKAEEEIKKNETDQVTKKAAIESQKKVVEAAKKQVESVK